MSTKLDLDIAAMVGEMEAPPCEHSQHGTPGFAHDSGPATHYVESACPGCDNSMPIRPVCSRYAALIRTNGRMTCSLGCGYFGTASEFTTILGPVNK